LVFGVGVLSLGRSFAGESERDARDKHTTSVHTAQPAQNKAVQANRTHSLSDGNAHAVARSSPPNVSNLQPERAAPTKIHKPASKSAPAAASHRTTVNKLASHHEQPAQLPVRSETGPAVSGIGRGRSTTAGSVGGLMASSAKSSTAALDGAAMKRKSW
jgi:hypothetical protein